ncbi:hypothetical protein NDU88_008283 [Pleurodeles waltl]|uniref:Uncharacterized protein n=1 Tax=Pleurodeles waltl TaxID=8319 RepID=A0AAV7PNV2_PLEWA|nr:hypothetical protein NDU88_008283 [Pleurodeles waltl]
MTRHTPAPQLTLRVSKHSANRTETLGIGVVPGKGGYLEEVAVSGTAHCGRPCLSQTLASSQSEPAGPGEQQLGVEVERQGRRRPPTGSEEEEVPMNSGKFQLTVLMKLIHWHWRILHW